jgi:hypothetical protein
MVYIITNISNAHTVSTIPKHLGESYIGVFDPDKKKPEGIDCVHEIWAKSLDDFDILKIPVIYYGE